MCCRHISRSIGTHLGPGVVSIDHTHGNPGDMPELKIFFYYILKVLVEGVLVTMGRHMAFRSDREFDLSHRWEAAS